MIDIIEDEIEHAYWDFNSMHMGYGEYKGRPYSERDAFKWAVRKLLAGQQKEKPKPPKFPKPMSFIMSMIPVKEQK